MFQASLLDQAESTAIAPSFPGLERTQLAGGAWVDLCRSWFRGSARLFDRLEGEVAWRAERRPMYDRIVDVPRLVHFYPEGAELPAPVLAEAREELNERYRSELEKPLCTAGLCLYRDGQDSVAWHGDTIGRDSRKDTIVAIVSLGASRRMLLRPRNGGAAHSFTLYTGDLFVMGGSCQRTWQHSIPKTARAVGARISVQFRPPGVR